MQFITDDNKKNNFLVTAVKIHNNTKSNTLKLPLLLPLTAFYYNGVYLKITLNKADSCQNMFLAKTDSLLEKLLKYYF